MGGIIGNIYGSEPTTDTDSVNIENCYTTGNLSANGCVGGIVGNSYYTDLVVKNCYSNSNIKVVAYEAGGLIGYRNGNNALTTIENCYSMGYVDGTTDSGGFLGSYELWDNDDIIKNCYYDIQKSGKDSLTKDDTVISANIIDSKGLSSAEMLDANNFVGWDTDVWDFSKGKPTLKNMPIYAGDLPNYVRLQIGEASEEITNSIMLETSISLRKLSVDFSTAQAATDSIMSIDEMLNTITNKMAEIGATQNRLESVMDSQSTRILNYTSAKTTIMDADVAEESAAFVKEQILQRTTGSLLSQAQNLHAGVILNLINSLK